MGSVAKSGAHFTSPRQSLNFPRRPLYHVLDPCVHWDLCQGFLSASVVCNSPTRPRVRVFYILWLYDPLTTHTGVSWLMLKSLGHAAQSFVWEFIWDLYGSCTHPWALAAPPMAPASGLLWLPSRCQNGSSLDSLSSRLRSKHRSREVGSPP